MNSSDIPSRTTKAFGVNGDKNTIPVDSSSTTLNGGQATMDSGFPPITRIPLSAGGKPPAGQDFNGILYSVSLKQQWQDAGMAYPFSADFSTAISGYPKGAKLPNSTLTGAWLNTVDGNTSTPEVGSSTLTGWVPAGDYGFTTISGLAATSVTLTTLQASKDRLILNGTLTANINLIFPAWTKAWTIVNGCSGNFSVTAKTASGSGVVIPAGLTASVLGDGTNITQDTSLLGYPGRLLNTRTILSSQTYTPTPGTSFIRVEAMAPGGGSAGCPATSASQTGGCPGGYHGQCIDVIIPASSLPSSVSVAIGQPGVAGNGAAGTTGGAGGNIVFGSIFMLAGGPAGAAGTVGTGALIAGTLYLSGQAYSSTITPLNGTNGITRTPQFIQVTAGVATGYSPYPSPFNGGYYGSGAEGVYSVASSAQKSGFAGRAGIVIIREYS